jgi:hypothetical protein
MLPTGQGCSRQRTCHSDASGMLAVPSLSVRPWNCNITGEDRCSLASAHSYVVFRPGGGAVPDQGPTRCWHRTPSGHAPAHALTTTTGWVTLATPAACSPLPRRLRQLGHEAGGSATPASRCPRPEPFGPCWVRGMPKLVGEGHGSMLFASRQENQYSVPQAIAASRGRTKRSAQRRRVRLPPHRRSGIPPDPRGQEARAYPGPA